METISYDACVGTDTSTVTIEWAMSLLLNHPSTMDEAQAELDDVIGQDSPLLVHHESSEDCTIGDFNVPRGTMVLVNAWAIQRDPRVRDDPTSFKVDRYEGLEGGHANRLLLFGMGRRSCPGAGLANRVVGLALVVLLQCCEWERIDEEQVDLSKGMGLTMPKRQPLEAMCKVCECVIDFGHVQMLKCRNAYELICN
ncbi:hypothetical protein EUGRSUZ_F00149 [Eucalyptus grandis]|uniref:Uncharacterized protein n=2 Tax=Eucalyptus grandis TaxID=71139 RepID=A0ACC3KAN5_EUCGR|nr:hypothetical protein EUGRSUZ_F00149 [Eucalyptus grandis]